MQFRNRLAVAMLVVPAVLTFVAPAQLRAQDDDSKPEQHGRKYKAPPETAHIEVTVVKGFNNKPIDGAHVIFHPVDKDGTDEGNLEIKTHEDGKAVIDVIPVGSSLRIQVLADGFSTFANDYTVDQPSRQITISMIRPRAQISTYVDNDGKPSQMQPGVQEPIRPKKNTAGSSNSGSSSTPQR